MEYHIPVMLSEVIEGLKIKSSGVYVDVTYGAGGHSKAIFEKLEGRGRLYAFDQDADARANMMLSDGFVLVPVNYRYLYRYMDYYDELSVDGVLADLGVSSHQFDEASRGFSFRFDEELDMRMDQKQGYSAIDILNSYREEELVAVLSEYGEVRNAKTLAREIVKVRKVKSVRTSDDFNRILDSCLVGDRNKYFSQVYQAIRIEVNDEIGGLVDMLEGALRVLTVGGRMAVMSYHSLEDRVVKNFFKTGNAEGRREVDDFGVMSRPFKLINKKPIVASVAEVKLNSRARSAKLRIVEKL